MKWLSIALLLTAGCSGPYTLAVENEFTDREAELIAQAAKQWITACDCDEAAIFFRFDLEDPDGVLTYEEWDSDPGFGRLWKMHITDPAYQERLRRRGPFNGTHKNGQIAIVAERTDSDKMFLNVILHELAHLYGVEHQDSGIMHEKGASADNVCIDWRALSAFCDLHDCGPAADTTCGKE